MFDRAKADRAIKFIKHLKHTKGRWAGIPFNLQKWQEKQIRKIFGTVKEVPKEKCRYSGETARVIRTVFKTVARKNGKSEEAAFVALLLLYADREPGAEIYSAAADREQASIVFNVAVQMIRYCPELSRRCKILESTKRIILNADPSSFYRVLSAEHASAHGFNAHGIIFDELHTQPNRHLWDVLTTSGGTRTQPLIYAITTAGYDKQSICFEQYQYAKKVQRGVIKDPSFYPIIYELSKKDDWKNKSLWSKANPALNVFREIEEMEIMYKKALVVPSLQNTFRRLYLNQWTSQREKWLSMESWEKCNDNFSAESLEKMVCYGGLDLASKEDIAAFVLVFEIDGNYYILPWFWCPEEKVGERYERGQTYYKDWVDYEYLETTPGNAIDYRYIRKAIIEIGKIYNIREIAFDDWAATEIIQYLEDDGFKMIKFRQGTRSYKMPMEEILRLILRKELHHNNNPVMNWMVDNVVVKQDVNANMMPDKKNSQDKIDGFVAMVMGLSRAILNVGNTSVYEERGVLMI